jgi:hypothetical protein
VHERVLGREHPGTLDARYQAAYWTGQAGDLTEALAQLRALVPLIERVNGAEDPGGTCLAHIIRMPSQPDAISRAGRAPLAIRVRLAISCYFWLLILSESAGLTIRRPPLFEATSLHGRRKQVTAANRTRT